MKFTFFNLFIIKKRQYGYTITNLFGHIGVSQFTKCRKEVHGNNPLINYFRSRVGAISIEDVFPMSAKSITIKLEPVDIFADDMVYYVID